MRSYQTSCGALIRQIHGTLEKNANNTLRRQDLTFAQVGALLAIRDYPEEQISLKELERLLHVAQSTTTGIVLRLEQKGLVTSLGDAADKRVKLLQITPEGLRCCEQAEQSMGEAEEQLLAGLTDAERSMFNSLLQKVKDTLH